MGLLKIILKMTFKDYKTVFLEVKLMLIIIDDNFVIVERIQFAS